AVDAEPMTDPAERAEVVRRRLAFEADPAAFRRRWAEADRLEGQRIAEAQIRLPHVAVPDRVLFDICTLCARDGAEGLRAAITIHKAASARAAYEGRQHVPTSAVEPVADPALAHRRTSHGTPPPPPPHPRPGSGDRPEQEPAPDLPDRTFYAGRGDQAGSG